jgi:hypothetical protein
MNFIKRELDKISAAISQGSNREPELYAAQQALAWASEPTGFASPFAMIMGTRASSGDCLVSSNPAPSEYVSDGPVETQR